MGRKASFTPEMRELIGSWELPQPMSCAEANRIIDFVEHGLLPGDSRTKEQRIAFLRRAYSLMSQRIRLSQSGYGTIISVSLVSPYSISLQEMQIREGRHPTKRIEEITLRLQYTAGNKQVTREIWFSQLKPIRR